MEQSNERDVEWLGVIGRALAFLCLKQGGPSENLAEQSLFLERLGLSRKEAASLLGTSTSSLSVLVGRVAKKKGGARARKKKK